jgi:hypothetical protein
MAKGDFRVAIRMVWDMLGLWLSSGPALDRVVISA